MRRFGQSRSNLLNVFIFAALHLNIFFFFSGLGGKRIAMNIYNKSLLPEDTLSLAA